MSEPLTVWVTRTADGAKRTARAIEALGHTAIVAPVLAVEVLNIRLDDPFDAVVFTSRNGVHAFAHQVSRRDIAVWCVGDATADAARAAGFDTVVSAGGDAHALLNVMTEHAPRDVRYVYASALRPSEPLTAWLSGKGFSVTEIPFYDTIAWTPDLSKADLNRMTHVLIHSARGGREVAFYLKAHGKFAFTNLQFICMSEKAWWGFEFAAGDLADNVRHRIAREPTEAAMLELLGADAGQ